MLPFTPAANTEMLAKRIYPQRRISVKFHDTCLSIIMLLTYQLQIHYISRCCKRDEYYQIVHSCQSLAFGCYSGYFYLLQQG